MSWFPDWQTVQGARVTPQHEYAHRHIHEVVVEGTIECDGSATVRRPPCERNHQLKVIEMEPCTHCGAWAADFSTEDSLMRRWYGMSPVPDPVKRCPCRLVAS